MSLVVDVDGYSGYRANERPIRFWLDATIHENELTGVYEIETVEERWYEPDAEYFKVRATDGMRDIPRYDDRGDQSTSGPGRPKSSRAMAAREQGLRSLQ